ncbi:MAG: sodium:solute symporter [Bryobacteraceae bacterium]
MTLGMAPLDLAILLAYFAVVTYIGVVVGRKRAKSLADFFIAGGQWGPFVSFIFVIASVMGGSAAVVVSGGAYRSGLSGVWYYWHPLFAVPIYFLFATIYKRSRVFNAAEFFEMRYGRGVAMLYAVLGMAALMLDIGGAQLAVGKIIAGLTGLSVDQAVLAASVVAALSIASGGQMSTLLTDMFTGVLILTVYCFMILPYLWNSTGGFQALSQLPPRVWSLESLELTPAYIFALSFSASFGSIVSPALFSWIVVGKDERTATQCAWAHLWKRTVTLLFALYGILFFLHTPGLKDAELAWGVVMQEIVPVGVKGLMVAAFFAALMSSLDSMASTVSALSVDHILRKRLFPGRSLRFYLTSARVSAFLTVFVSYLLTRQFRTLVEFIEVVSSFSVLLCVPLYFGIVWRRANRRGMWAALSTGVSLLIVTRFWLRLPFPYTVFIPTLSCALVMYLVSRATRPESQNLLNRFYCVLHTPLGMDHQLKAVGIRLPGMSGVSETEELTAAETLDADALETLYRDRAALKVFGPESAIEIVREPGLGWYYRGFVTILLACCFLLAAAWAVGPLMSWASVAK